MITIFSLACRCIFFFFLFQIHLSWAVKFLILSQTTHPLHLQRRPWNKPSSSSLAFWFFLASFSKRFMFLFHRVSFEYFCPWNFCTLRFCIYYLAITAKTLLLNLQVLRTRKTTQKSFSCLNKAVDDACMHEKRNQLFPHPFLFFSEEKTAKTSLLEKSFSLVGSGLPFSRFIQAVFMGDSFFRCPASKYSRCGCFLSLEREK